ncbi:transposase [Streptomyces sp. SID3343]|uniref:transposase n=1 Tax=Streptomyces sp. SID3343 TaxID=2690260 RepID=UPI001370A741|nr:transposase [Streptomyces sp. SID3343]MYW04145.1 hypothetical protein [Streptomyces sp. SID3343]
MRRVRVYGTGLVDVDSGRAIDLLPDREATTLVVWLADRPDIEVVCRDRAPFFADGARLGAPTALQVADRFHLWHDLGEAAERCVSRHRSCLKAVPGQTEIRSIPVDEAGDSPWPTGHRVADGTREKHAVVHAFPAEGLGQRAICRRLGMGSLTEPFAPTSCRSEAGRLRIFVHRRRGRSHDGFRPAPKGFVRAIG